MEIFEFLKHLHDEGLRMSYSFRFDKTNSRHFHLIGLYGTLIELTGCLVTLIEKKCWTGVLSIFRTILEAYVEFHNLYETPEYINHMKAAYHEQWIKVLKEARDNSNSYLKRISTSQNLDEQIKKFEAELRKLREDGYLPLNICQRFKRAEMIDGYRSLYNFLCTDAHNNIRALFKRHKERKAQKRLLCCLLQG